MSKVNTIIHLYWQLQRKYQDEEKFPEEFIFRLISQMGKVRIEKVRQIITGQEKSKEELEVREFIVAKFGNYIRCAENMGIARATLCTRMKRHPARLLNLLRSEKISSKAL